MPGARYFAGSPTSKPPYAINNQGQVVGDYKTPAGLARGLTRLADGTIILIEVPGASTTPGRGALVLGINESGWDVGPLLGLLQHRARLFPLPRRPVLPDRRPRRGHGDALQRYR